MLGTQHDSEIYECYHWNNLNYNSRMWVGLSGIEWDVGDVSGKLRMGEDVTVFKVNGWTWRK